MSTALDQARDYELLVILDPRFSDDEIHEAVERLSSAISERGEVVRMDRWGRRKLAYEIPPLREGYFVAANFKGDTGLVKELDRLFKFGGGYVRSKVVRVEQ